VTSQTSSGASKSSNVAAAGTDPRYAALAKAQATDQPVTVGSMTTGDSTTQALPDGNLATTTTVLPTRMQDASGAWVDIDPTLIQNPDGTITTTATPNKLTLSNGGTGPVITASDPSGNSMALSLPVSLPVPTLSGASATYSDIYPGIDFTVTADPSGGFSEVFTVENATAETQAQNLQLTTSLSGLTLTEQSDGSLDVVDNASGQTVMAAPSAVMWDSATDGTPANNVPDDFETVTNATSSTAGPGLGAYTGALPITDTSGTLILDGAASRLDTTNPTYPLYLDPTWVRPFQSGGTNNYTEAQAGCANLPNWDNVSEPGVGYNDINGDGNCPGYGAYESFFDLNSSNLNSNDKIASSEFLINEVYSADDSCGQNSQTVSIKWTGSINSGTDWNNKPTAIVNANVPEPVDSEPLKTDGNSDGSTCSGGTVSANLNVSSAVITNAANNGSHITLGLYGDESGSWESLERFNNNPSLYTIYDIAPNMPTNLTVTPNPIDKTGAVDENCGGQGDSGFIGIDNIGGNHAAVLSAKLTSPIASAQMQGRFHLRDVTTDWDDYETSAGYAVSGGTVNLTTVSLSDGHLYGWQLDNWDQYYASTESPMCYFYVDLTPPLNPTVTSTDFPQLGSGKSNKTTGQSGNFTLTSNDPAPTGGVASGLKGFYYSYDTPVSIGASSTSFAAQDGNGKNAATAAWSTSSWGVHTLYVQAEDYADNLSAMISYSFYVPWTPGTTPTPGDISGDHIPDLVTTDNNGNLVEYKGGSDPTTPKTISNAADSPNKKSWTGFIVTHGGSFTGAGADDLIALDTNQADDAATGDEELYIYHNDGSGTFNNLSNIYGPITKAMVTNDDQSFISPGADVNGTGSNGCLNTGTGSCTDYNYKADWNGTTQIVAAGDFYKSSPDASALDSGIPGLLTVENGDLWYYQGIGKQNYINTAIQLGTSTSTDSWNNYTLLAPGTVNNVPVIWARNNNTGTIYQYAITYDSTGYPNNLHTPQSGSGIQLSIPGTGTHTVGTPSSLSATAAPHISSPGNLHDTSSIAEPDIVTTTDTGELIDYPGAAPTSAGLATFADPIALGNPTQYTSTTEYTFPDDNTYYPTGSVWIGTKTTMTFDEGLLALTDTATGKLLASYGKAGNPNAYLVLQSDGNLVIYNDFTNPTAIWVVNHLSGVTISAGDHLTLGDDGNLAIYSSTNSIIWASGTGH
jgi:hypothetical protein